MVALKGIYFWVCVMFFGVCCSGAEQKDGACVPYYLCDPDTNTILTDGRALLKQRAGVPTCEFPLDTWCKLPTFARNRTKAVLLQTSTPSEEPTLALNPSTEVDTPEEPLALCGVRRESSNSPSSASQNGVNTGATSFAEFPWMVVLLQKIYDSNTYFYKHKCGASLVHPKIVVTAAHCVAGVDKDSLKVRAGEWDTLTESEPLPHQDRKAKQIIVHPEFDVDNLHNDIAVIIVDSPFKMTDNVDLICMPLQDTPFDTSRCVVSGWGKDSTEEPSLKSILRKVDMGIVHSDECQERLRLTRLGAYFNLHESFICAGGEVGKDTCEGDGGSPLVCPDPIHPKRWTQAGIVSWGIECNDGNPAVYTKFSHFTQWIFQKMIPEIKS